MKTLYCKIVTFIFVFAICFGVASASFANNIPSVINVPDGIENGSVSVRYYNNNSVRMAEITASPEKEYALGGLKLIDANGNDVKLTAVSGLVYRCEMPESDCSLQIVFRRARVVIDDYEFALTSAGSSVKLGAEVEYVDDDIDTRNPVFDGSIVFNSSNPGVASVDSCGTITPHKAGYARITASAGAANYVSSACYVTVDADKSEVVGKLRLVVRFSADDLIKYLDWGHSFLMFTSYKDGLTLNTPDMYEYYAPNEKYYEAVNNWDGNGYDPVTYKYAVGTDNMTDENEPARRAYADSLFTRLEKEDCPTYVVNQGEIATFGCTDHATVDESLHDLFKSGDFPEVMERYGKKEYYLKQIQLLTDGKIGFEEFWNNVTALLNEIGYDFSSGYMPINGHDTPGGVSLNGELYEGAYCYDQSTNSTAEIEITQIQLDAMMDYLNYDNYFCFLTRNCTYVAAKAWNIVTAARPELYLNPNRGGITSAMSLPVWLKHNLLNMSVVFAKDKTISFDHFYTGIKPDKKDTLSREYKLGNLYASVNANLSSVRLENKSKLLYSLFNSCKSSGAVVDRVAKGDDMLFTLNITDVCSDDMFALGDGYIALEYIDIELTQMHVSGKFLKTAFGVSDYIDEYSISVALPQLNGIQTLSGGYAVFCNNGNEVKKISSSFDVSTGVVTFIAEENGIYAIAKEAE